MNVSREEKFTAAVNALLEATGNRESLAAYPIMAGYFHGVQASIQNLANQTLKANREEQFFGTSPVAMLYRRLQKREIRIMEPEFIAIEDTWQTYIKTTRFDRVLNLIKYGRQSGRLATDQHDEIHLAKGTRVVKVNNADGSGTISWSNSDMYIEVADFSKCRGVVKCPLFDKGYETALNPAMMEQVITEMAMAVYGEYPIIVDRHDIGFLHRHYSAGSPKSESRLDEAEPTPYEILSDLLSRSQYERPGELHMFGWNRSDSAIVEHNGLHYTFTAGYIPNHPSEVLVLKRIHCYKTPGDHDTYVDVTDRMLDNPWVVEDILKDLSVLVDKALTSHHAAAEARKKESTDQ